MTVSITLCTSSESHVLSVISKYKNMQIMIG